VDLTRITPDEVVLWSWGPLDVNLTIVSTWGVMLLLIAGSWLVTRRLSTETAPARWQHLLEVVIDYIRGQIREISGGHDPDRYLPFVGTLFLYIAVSNLLMIVPGYVPGTASLSTTAALALCALIAVPVYAVTRQGLRAYLRHYVQPSPLMLPFTLIGELSRTLALAVRLFGNVMSGTKIVAVLLAVAPLFFPAVLGLLGLLTGFIQAYIFAVLSMVYIASGMQAQREPAPTRTSATPTARREHHPRR
jgi:F-type H+-transporting ATPase subunit a